jgi:uncharacterized membrane protein
METLGRLCNVIPIAAGKPFRLRGASVAMFVVTGAAAQPTLNQRSTFAGADTVLTVIRNVYWSTATDGTVGWSKTILAAPASTYIHGTTAGLTTAAMTVFHVYTSQLTDPSAYLNVVSTAGPALVSAYVGDLTVQRAPANLEVLGA